MSKEKKIRLSGYIPESVNDKVVTRADEKHEGNKNKAIFNSWIDIATGISTGTIIANNTNN